MDNSVPTPLPLHRRISDELRREIERGTFEVGRALPSEADLMVRFGVSRGTIRQALDTLRTDGTIAGPRGTPPVVRGRRMAQPFTELLSFSTWVRSLGRQPAGQVVEFVRRSPSDEVVEALGLRPGEPAHHLVRVRLADGEPLMIERTVFPAEVGMLVEQVDLEHDSIYATLATRGIVFDSARQAIDALAATAVDARLLGVSPRTPLLRVRRLSFSPNGRPLEWSDDRYRGDRMSLTIEHTAARPALARSLAT